MGAVGRKTDGSQSVGLALGLHRLVGRVGSLCGVLRRARVCREGWVIIA